MGRDLSRVPWGLQSNGRGTVSALGTSSVWQGWEGGVGWGKTLSSAAAQSEGGGTTPAPWAFPVLSRGFHSLVGRAASTPT